MPAPPNRTLRFVVTLVVIVLGIGLVFAFMGGGGGSPGTPAPGQQPAQADGADGQDGSPAPAGPPSQSEGQPAPEGGAGTEESADAEPPEELAELGTLSAKAWPDPPTPDPVGNLDYRSGPPLQLKFTLLGAGVDEIILSDYFNDVEDALLAQKNPRAATDHYVIQHRVRVQRGDVAQSIASLAARAVSINGQVVDLFSLSPDGHPVWRETAPGEFECVVVDEQDRPVARITKRYELEDTSYDIRVAQQLENLTDGALSIEWFQYGPMALEQDASGYKIDSRRVRFGYTLQPHLDPSQRNIRADSELLGYKGVVSAARRGESIWPDPDRFKGANQLSWVGQTNRYFAFAVHPYFDEGFQGELALDLAGGDVRPIALESPAQGQPAAVVLQLHSDPKRVGPGAALDLGFGAYAGPLGRKTLATGVTSAGPDPNAYIYQRLNLAGMVEYSLGMCAMCTFQWLAKLLLSVLEFFHNTIAFGDWALSIMLLVVCVRGVLHPLTKRSQVGLQRFSKQMQAVAPKQKKLQEKYKDDPKRLQQEMIRLMREEGVDYRGAFGCLPMFLQMPIWVALYAMLYFAFELRHQPAFWGVFQRGTGGSWSFLSDLSTADHFIDFGRTLVSIPLMGDISGFNILPILLGIVFFIHQKYMTPPPSSTMTPEQQTQQKMMKVMFVVMFPVMMYNAPSGLALYFITNSTLGILESRYIRAHVNKLDLEPKKPRHAQLGRKKISHREPSNPFKRRKGGDPDKPRRYKQR